MNNIRLSILATLVAISSFASMGDEWDMDFPRDWTWEYVIKNYPVYPESLVRMGFTGRDITFKDKIYHEFARKEVTKFTNMECTDSIVDSEPYPNSRYIRQENGKVYIFHGDIDSSVASSGKEFIIYDFSAADGDIVELPSSNYYQSKDKMRIKYLDPVTVNGKECHAFNLMEYDSDYFFNPDMIIIETIGVTTGGTLANFTISPTLGAGGSEDYTALYCILLQVYDGDGKCVFRHPEYDKYAPHAAIDTITEEQNNEITYFNLQGQQVTAPVKGELYILRDNRGARKVVF